MAEKMKKCKACGAEIASSAAVCPKCGAKNKKPIYKKWWFWVIIVIIAAAVIGSAGSSGSSGSSNSDSGNTNPSTGGAQTDTTDSGETGQDEPEQITYTHYNVTELFDTLSSNALKAKNTFQDQYVELEGYLSVIDSDGKYVSIGADPENMDYLLQTVQCYIKSDEQLEKIMEMSAGDPIVVCGKITDIGEVLGYSMNIDSIE